MQVEFDEFIVEIPGFKSALVCKRDVVSGINDGDVRALEESNLAANDDVGIERGIRLDKNPACQERTDAGVFKDFFFEVGIGIVGVVEVKQHGGFEIIARGQTRGVIGIPGNTGQTRGVCNRGCGV